MDRNAHPHKKRKVEPLQKFNNVQEITQSFQAQNVDAIAEALNRLRNQLTIKAEEGLIAPHDERLILAQQWLETNPGANDVFSLWETSNPRHHTLPIAIVSLLAATITLLSSHYTYHATGYTVVKTLLTPQWMRRLGSYLGGSQNELILVTLKLFIAISGFASGREKKTLLEAFPWEVKSLPKLMNLRRKGTNDYNPLLRPDIRTLYILFLLSFLDAPTQTKNMFFEQHRDAFLAIFKGLPQDHYHLIRHVLEIIWTKLWADPKIKRTVKVNLFNEATIFHLFKLYDRTTPDDEDPEHVAADVVHHFLLAIMTRPGTGICFKDRGWYSREDSDDEKGGKIYNKILANVLKTLKVNEDSRQQELAHRIFDACPELVSGYWPAAQLTLEPRLATKWISNISFFGTIISLPVPESSFLLPNTTTTNPTPPPLSHILSNILPSDISPKTVFTKGLLSSSGLVQHCTALTLTKCLLKYARVIEVFKRIEDSLEVSDTEEGQWGKRRKEIEKEVRKRIPEFQVIVGFSQQKTTTTPTPISGSGPTETQSFVTPTPNPIRNALLQESAQRLLLLYHRYLPEVVVEARFDVGKALSSFTHESTSGPRKGNGNGDGDVEGKEDTPEAAKKLRLVQQLHVLRTLKESDQFVWTNKSASSRTYIYVLLKSYNTTSIPSLKATLFTLITHLLSNSILFQEKPNEASYWLLSLPHLQRTNVMTIGGDDVLTDESESVINFLDDCIQRALRTPFRYIEQLQNLLSSTSPSTSSPLSTPPTTSPSKPTPPTTLTTNANPNDVYDTSLFPSPLLATISEQLEAKTKAGLLAPSDILAIVSFIRKLCYRLISDIKELKVLVAFVDLIGRIVSEDRLLANEKSKSKEKCSLMMCKAIRREVEIMVLVVKRGVVGDDVELPEMSDSGVQDILDQIDSQVKHESDTPEDRMKLAHSVIDRLRFLDQPLSSMDAVRFVKTVEKIWKPALEDLAEYLFPGTGCLEQNHTLVGIDDERSSISANWIFYNSTKKQISDISYRQQFIKVFISSNPTLQNYIEMLRLIEHRLRHSSSSSAKEESRALFSLLSLLTTEAKASLQEPELTILKENLFSGSSILKKLSMSQDQNQDDSLRDSVEAGLKELLHSCFDSRSSVDRRILSEISDYWFAVLQSKLQVGMCKGKELGHAALWIKYLPPSQILCLLDQITVDSSTSDGNNNSISLLQSILDIIQNSIDINAEAEMENALRQRIPQLLKIRKIIVDFTSTSTSTSTIEELLASAIDSRLPVGYTSSAFTLDKGNQNLQDLETPLSTLIKLAESRWTTRTRSGSKANDNDFVIPVADFLNSTIWIDATVKIIRSLIYGQVFNVEAFEGWLKEGNANEKKTEHLTVVLNAALDVYQCSLSSEKTKVIDEDVWMPYLKKIASLCASNRRDQEVESTIRRIGCSVLTSALKLFKNNQNTIVNIVLGEIEDRRPALEVLSLAILQPDVMEIIPPLLESCLKYLISKFASHIVLSDMLGLFTKETMKLVGKSTSVKTHQVETLLGVVIQNHLSNAAPIDLVESCLSKTHLKPVSVNRYIQSILQHPHFFKFVGNTSSSGEKDTSPRTHIIQLLHTLFNLHPTNTCQITQVEPLLHVYNGTLSKEDLQIFSIFQLFEVQRKISLAPLFNRWSSSSDIPASSAFEGVQSLEPNRVLKTTLQYPKWRKLSGGDSMVAYERDIDIHESQCYDPIFVLLLFHQVLSGQHPHTPFGWIEIFRTNIVGLCLRTLSSKDDALREFGLSQIITLYQCMENVDIQEKPHVMYILNILKDLFQRPEPNQPLRRLPSYTTLILSHALRGIFYPSNFIYPLTARFLLQRPELDVNDVPMLYNMLYSNSDDWKKERGWIIKFLSDGMVGSDDWRVLQRRHTWDLIASIFQSNDSEHPLRKVIFEVIANLTCTPQALMSMILKSSFLTWLEMQISRSNADESLPWVRILGNVILTVESGKLDYVLKDAWRNTILRCLSSLLSQANSDIILPSVVPILLKMSLLSNPQTKEFDNTLRLAFKSLQKLEPSVQIYPTSTSFFEFGLSTSQKSKSLRWCHGYALQDPIDETISHSYETWLECVTSLWRTTMNFESKTSIWDSLTLRLLLSTMYNYNLSGSGNGNENVESEWMRSEVVHCMQTKVLKII